MVSSSLVTPPSLAVLQLFLPRPLNPDAEFILMLMAPGSGSSWVIWEVREPATEAAGLLLHLPRLSLICVLCLVSPFAAHQASDCSCIGDFSSFLALGDLLILL